MNQPPDPAGTSRNEIGHVCQKCAVDLWSATEGGSLGRMAPKKKSRTMSDEHKAALAEGRSQGRAVRRYLEALEANKPKRGRKRTPEGIQRRLAAIEERMASADA